MLDARERAQAAKLQAQLGAAASRTCSTGSCGGDRLRGRHPVVAGRPRCLIGILLALGLMLALRATRGGQLAH